MIEIKGLSALQTDIANKLWGLESLEEVDEFISTLPRSLRIEARTVQEMMIAATFDQYTDTDLAKQILDRIAN